MGIRTRGRDSQEPQARLVTYKDRAIGIRWKSGKHEGEESTGTTDRDEAIGQRAVLLANLKAGILPRGEPAGPAMRWKDFRTAYESQYLVTLSEGSSSAWTTAANWLEKLIKPRRLSDLNKASLSKFHGLLLCEELAPASAATYLRTIRAAIGWAYDLDYVDSVPRLRVHKGMKRQSGMRSRPVNAKEFDAILTAVAVARPKDTETWRRFILGLSLSSLRVDELRRLAWDDQTSDLSIDTTGKIPFIKMMAEGHKAQGDCYQPITIEFWNLITSDNRPRVGYVFPLPGRKGQMTRKRVIRTVSAIGRAAGIVTNARTNKMATSHDIGRRAFLTNLSTQLSMSQTQAWARHSDPRTTSQYYIRHEAESLAKAAGWEELQIGCKPISESGAVPTLKGKVKPRCQRT